MLPNTSHLNMSRISENNPAGRLSSTSLLLDHQAKASWLVSCWTLRSGFCSLLVLSFTLLLLDTSRATAQAPASQPAALGDAFQSMFYPAPRSMGLIQRTNYFDDLLRARGRLEIALVIDGTESMGEQLLGVQSQLGSLVENLRRVVGDQLAVQMLIYRDVGAPSGTITWPLQVPKNSWATADADIAKGISKLVPESGAPYYYEPVDVAVHSALTELNWTAGEKVTRWLFVIGDAPPFQVGFRDDDNQAQRKYDVEALKRLAVDKQVKIYGIVCPSRPEDQKIHEQVLPECREFFQELTEATGGSLMDLSDPNMVSQVHAAAELAHQNLAEFKPITKADLDEARKLAKKPLDKVVVAVVPFLEIKDMSFNTNNPMVHLAEELRSELNSNKVQTVQMEQLRQIFPNISSRAIKDESMFPQQLAKKVRADYVIWRHQPVTGSTFQVAVINAQSGKIESVSDPIEVNRSDDKARPTNVRLCSQVLQSLASKSRNSSTPIAKLFTPPFRTRLVSTTEESTKAVETARLEIERSLRNSANLSAGDELFAARELLLSVESSMKNDPLWNNLMANVHYSLALKAKANKKPTGDLLTLARKYSDTASRADEEFMADHYFIQKKYPEAIAAYEAIVASAPNPDATRRSHWMLVFLYAGDWGVVKDLQNMDKSRQHAISLLAQFPESLEAEALKRAIHWSDEEQRSIRPTLVVGDDPSPSDKR